MGRPRIYDEPRVTSAFRLTPAMRDELRRRACEQGISVNQLVVRTLSEYLGELPRRARHPRRQTAS
jgi:hypothetical protein